MYQYSTGKAAPFRRACAAVFVLSIFWYSCGSEPGQGDDAGSALFLSSRASELPVRGDGTYISPDTGAVLVVDGPVRRLKLTGTRAEMGYNYGYLLAAEIMNTVNLFSCWLARESRYDYDVLAGYQSYFAWDADTLAELEGMLEGMRDALPEENLTVRPLRGGQHQLGLDDLKILNTLADWACSSFSVWGAGRGGDAGKALIARNLDYYIDPGGWIKKAHVIVAYEPDSGTRWVNVSFCGVIGCISGMNESGISAVTHNTGYFPTTDTGGFVPRIIALRKAMETLDGGDEPSDAEALFDMFPNYQGNNFHICFPTFGRTTDDEVAGVLEYDGKADHADGRATHRKPSDNPSLPWDSSYDQRVPVTYVMINTNHYLKRKTDIPHDNSAGRFCTIKQMLGSALVDGHVTRDEGRDIMDAVGGYGTLHTIIFEPDSLLMRIYLSSGDKGAFEYSPADFDFEDLF